MKLCRSQRVENRLTCEINAGKMEVSAMKREPRELIFVIVSLCLLMAVGLSIGRSRSSSFTSAAMRRDSVAGQVKEIAGYRNWAKVNPVPQVIPDPVAQLCAIQLSPVGVQVDGATNPHRRKYLTVYVNDVGRKAMLESKTPSFPPGSVIVKEKLPSRDSADPEMMTVMIKREKGFNPASGDWEYMVVDGTGTTVQARGKLENCQSCHSARPKTDYVFRTYLSDEAMNRLK